MDIQRSGTAVVFIDPQNDVLSEHGANWAAVGASVTENASRHIISIRPTAVGNSTDRSRPTNSELAALREADRWI